ncbi:putative mitochondrial aspartyl-tRNA synthetase [Kockovaella imperatae]|uniref:Putative mitochondrial aspartyl-tRNA synthetase n=1 Tax=Kockovaella imperatae TaxID=4999 RepID=A0A1Y1U6B5_9TREE|nr:putative mitochondrial aspartyl-tRNA synthetase [Kockovaella imperatae]ORX33558.1 putative mitochondrial aspartyl-tRNA synthetase [Kockovaella imperatae]
MHSVIRGACRDLPVRSRSRMARLRFRVGLPNQQHRPYNVTSSLSSETSSASSNLPIYRPREDGLEPHHGHRPPLTHEIAQLSATLEGQSVSLGGWIFSQRRASASLHFFTLRDTSASVQLVCKDSEISQKLMDFPLESVVSIQGIVRARKQKAKAGPSSATLSTADEVEVEVTGCILLNAADPLPFYASRQEMASEEIRAEHRYLDLRRSELAANLKLRSKVAHIIRCHLHDQKFDEVETPVLLNSSPEGAREFVVPTRTLKPSQIPNDTSLQPTFYALQQSPQQPKQLLIASGATSRYFQIARCFRDEDGRKDRQPEFTQVDLEMGFVEGTGEQGESWECSEFRTLLIRERLGNELDTWSMGGQQVKQVVEGLIRKIWKEIKGIELGEFRCMPYQVAMDVYGSDKPDTRFEMFTLPLGYYPDLSDADLDKVLLDQSQYTVEWMITRSEHAKYLNMDDLRNDHVQAIHIREDNVKSWHTESPFTQKLGLTMTGDGAVTGGGVQPGDIIWLAQRKKVAEGGWTQLGRLRVQMLDELVRQGALKLSDQPNFLWITQFPLFTRADEDKAFLSKGRWASTHHPFTAPMFEDLEDLKGGNVEKVRGQHYDLVLDGQEIGGGSVRIHDANLQEYVMRDVLKLEQDEIARFSHLLQALRFGAPPHGGMALGLDRLVAILCGAKSIREVIAFPKTQAGSDPVFKSPSVVAADVLRDYGLESRKRS